MNFASRWRLAHEQRCILAAESADDGMSTNALADEFRRSINEPRRRPLKIRLAPSRTRCARRSPRRAPRPRARRSMRSSAASGDSGDDGPGEPPEDAAQSLVPADAPDIVRTTS